MTKKNQKPLKVWRVEAIDTTGRRRSVFGHTEKRQLGRPGAHPVDSYNLPTDRASAFDVTASACANGHDHAPPQTDCTCGIFGVVDVLA